MIKRALIVISIIIVVLLLFAFPEYSGLILAGLFFGAIIIWLIATLVYHIIEYIKTGDFDL